MNRRALPPFTSETTKRERVMALAYIPFHVLLLEERLTRACNLLRTTEMPLKAVAAAVGFSNEFYFNRLFAREYGRPPGEFRRREKIQAELQ